MQQYQPQECYQMNDQQDELSIAHLLGGDANDFDLSIELGGEDRVDHRAGVPAVDSRFDELCAAL
jgi:hypothetical protein